MGTEAHRKVQVFLWRLWRCSYVVDSKDDRTRAATPFVHDGGGDTDAVASSRELRRKAIH